MNLKITALNGADIERAAAYKYLGMWLGENLSVLDYGVVIYRHVAASVLKSLDTIYHSALFYDWG